MKLSVGRAAVAGFFFVFFFGFLLSPVTGYGQFIPKGDAAQVSKNCYRITPDRSKSIGSIWNENKIDLSKPFELSFTLALGAKDQTGGDGVAFVFQDDSRGLNAQGEAGRGLGYGFEYRPRPEKQFIQPSVAIEFDTFFNGDIGDIPDDHTTVVYNGQTDISVIPAMRIDPASGNVNDNTCRTFAITWNPALQELTLLLNGKVVFSHRDNIVQKVFKGNSLVYFGFTGATGGSFNEQTICLIDPDRKVVAQDDQAQAVPLTPVSINVLQNDHYSKTESVAVTQLVKQPANGTATFSGDQVNYTANRGFTGTDTFTYELCERAADVCFAQCATATVTVQVSCPPLPPPTLHLSGPAALCPGQTLRLTATAGENYLYQWYRNGQVFGAASVANYVDVPDKGVYYAEVKDVCGTVVSTEKVSISLNVLAAAPVVEASEQCGPGVVFLKAASAGAEGYRWYATPSAAVPLAEGTTPDFQTPPLTETTTYYVAAFRNGCESPKVPAIATILPLPEIRTEGDFILNLGESRELKASGGVRYQWQPFAGLSDPTIANPVARPQETTTYTVTATNAQGCENTASFTVTVVKSLIIPSAFSPNGDNVNDIWEITNLSSYPAVALQIYDRWGSRVYETQGYQNDWNGTRNGKPLPVGTYFYSITLSPSKTLTGAISIVR